MKKALLALVAVSLVACGSPEEKYMSKACDSMEEAVGVMKEFKDGKMEEADAMNKVKELNDKAIAYGKELGLKEEVIDSLDDEAMEKKCPDVVKKFMKMM